SVDVHFAREASAAAVGDGSPADAALTRDRELAAYRAADAVIAASDDDADLLKREGGMPPLFVVPVIVDAGVRGERPRAPMVIFVGGFSHPPNADAVRWFVGNVWPEVHRAVPGSVFQVVGSNVSPDVMALAHEPGVQVLGYVENLAPLLDDAVVSVAPLRYGA